MDQEDEGQWKCGRTKGLEGWSIGDPDERVRSLVLATRERVKEEWCRRGGTRQRLWRCCSYWWRWGRGVSDWGWAKDEAERRAQGSGETELILGKWPWVTKGKNWGDTCWHPQWWLSPHTLCLRFLGPWVYKFRMKRALSPSIQQTLYISKG